MSDVLMQDPSTGNVALYTEPTLAGDPFDPNSARNAPLNNPETSLEFLFYHSDHDPIEVVFGPMDISIVHATVPVGSGGASGATINGQLYYGSYIRDHLVFTHDLGYPPNFMITVGNQTLHPGYPVQFNDTDGRSRCVTAYATDTEIRLHEYGIQTSVALAGITITYTLMVFKRLPEPVGTVLFDFDPDTGIVKMARDKFSSDRRYLQIVEGGTPFAFPLGRTIDLANGTFRSVQPDGTIRDIVPASFRISVVYKSSAIQLGPAGNYTGDFAGDPSILVQAP